MTKQAIIESLLDIWLSKYKNFSEWFFDMLKSGLILHR